MIRESVLGYSFGCDMISGSRLHVHVTWVRDSRGINTPVLGYMLPMVLRGLYVIDGLVGSLVGA